MICSKCNKAGLTINDFYRAINRASGHTSYCKECHKALSRNSYKSGERTEYLRIYRQEWRKTHTEVYRKHKHDYRAKKALNGGAYTVDEWNAIKQQYKYTCPCCGKKEPEIKLTIDHIIPIFHGGTNNKENLQPLCKSCNSSKQTKIISYGIGGQLGFVLAWE